MLIELRENQTEISEITTTANEILYEDYNINLANNSVAIPTLAYSYMAAAVQYVASKKQEGQTVELNFGDFITFGISHSDVTAEKDGNYVPFVKPGVGIEKIVNGDKSKQEFKVDDETKEALEIIADDSIKFLRRRFDIGIDQQSNVVPTIAYVFLSASIMYLADHKTEDGAVEINMFQLMDVGVAHDEENGFKPFIVPGTDMKLMVKDDGDTEEE